MDPVLYSRRPKVEGQVGTRVDWSPTVKKKKKNDRRHMIRLDFKFWNEGLHKANPRPVFLRGSQAHSNLSVSKASRYSVLPELLR